MRWLLAVVLACACSKPDTVPSAVARVEKKLGHKLDGLIFTRQGLYVDRTFVTDTRLPEAIEKATPRELLDVWILDGDEPATTVIGALQVVADKHPRVRIHDADNVLCADAKLSSQQATGEPENMALSVMMTPERTWIGLSRVNEFMEVHEPAKLESSLADYKKSAFFEGRKNIELSAEPTIASKLFATTIAIACKVGFTELSMLRVEQISARPSL